MKKNILVTTGFSQTSFEIVYKALTFTKVQNSIFHVVHIVESYFLNKLEEETIVYENNPFSI